MINYLFIHYLTYSAAPASKHAGAAFFRYILASAHELYRIRTILVTVTNNVFNVCDDKWLIINDLLFWYGFHL